MSLPNLIIAGAPKSGTTSLFKWLQAHPSVATSQVKETYYLMDSEYPFFNMDSNYLTGGLEGYSKLFPEFQPGQLCIEATPDYMFQQTALKVLSELPKKPTIVFILRNPVDRVLSLLEFAKNNVGSLNINISAREFFERAKLNQFMEDEILNNALTHSEYHIWIERWIQAFEESKIKIIFFDEMVNDPHSLMSKICNQMGIDSGFYKNFEFKPENKSHQIRIGTLLKIKNFLNKTMPTLMRSSIFNVCYRAINVTSGVRKPENDGALINEMYEYFSEPNRKLALLLDRELPIGWMKH